VFPADFVILEMDFDTSVPLILGCPFLATARALSDMGVGVLTLRFGNDELKYRTGGVECVSEHPFDVADFINHNLDYQLKKLKGKGTAIKIPDLNNNIWIDELWDKQVVLSTRRTTQKEMKLERFVVHQLLLDNAARTGRARDP
jgi:hypothetical protein